MSDRMRVAVAQYAPAGSASENLQGIAAVLEGLAGEMPDVVVFPEYSSGFISGGGSAMAALAQPAQGPFVRGLHEISQAHGGVILVAGALLEDGGARNTIVAVGPDGVLAHAEKIHLYDAFGAEESSWLEPGRLADIELLEIGGHRLGFMACYDLRFPEVARRLVDAGASALVIPAQWVPGRNKVLHWETLLRARAIESQCFVIAAGQPSPEGVGHSQVIAPTGEVLVALGHDAGVAVAELDLQLVTDQRATNPMAQARRLGVHPSA